MGTSDKSPINLNTVLLSIVVALSAWTLKTVYEMSNALTAVTTRVDQHDRIINSFDGRISTNEREITNLRVRVAGRTQ